MPKKKPIIKITSVITAKLMFAKVLVVIYVYIEDKYLSLELFVTIIKRKLTIQVSYLFRNFQNSHA